MVITHFIRSTSARNEPGSRVLEPAQAVARAFATISQDGPDLIVVTGVLFPGGRAVGLRLSPARGGYTLSDDGSGAEEADQMGALPLYRKEAALVADESGLDFVDDALTALDVDEEKVAGIAVVLANAAAKAMQRVADRMAAEIESKE